jgi:hypothetical protein
MSSDEEDLLYGDFEEAKKEKSPKKKLEVGGWDGENYVRGSESTLDETQLPQVIQSTVDDDRRGDDAAPVDSDDEDDDGVQVLLEDTWVVNGAPRTSPVKQRRPEKIGPVRVETPLLLGAPPAVPLGGQTADCCVACAPLPFWLRDVDFRKYAETFGIVRQVRILENVETGMSSGCGLLEFTNPTAGLNAQKGIADLPVWRSKYKVTEPLKVVLWPEAVYAEVARQPVSVLEGGGMPKGLIAFLQSELGGSKRPAATPRRDAERARPARAEDDETYWNERLKRIRPNGAAT